MKFCLMDKSSGILWKFLDGEFSSWKESLIWFVQTVLETESYHCVTDNQMNSWVLQLIELMKKSEETRKRKQRYFIKMDKSSKYNFLGPTILLTGSFPRPFSLLVDFSCALKISTPVAYLTAIKRAESKWLGWGCSEISGSWPSCLIRRDNHN